jgi:hypothetical protein
VSDQFTNIIRTVVAAIAGSLGAFLVGHGLAIDSATIQALLFPLCIGLYQAAAVYSVRRWPNVFTLHMLGLPKVPVYVTATPAMPTIQSHDVTPTTVVTTTTEPIA